MIGKILRKLRRQSLSGFDIRQLKLEARQETIPTIQRLCNGVYLGNDTVLCRVLGKYKLYADAGDLSISPHLMIDGIWELWVAEVIVDLVKPGMTTVDVGANLGYFTLLMADLVGPEGSVHAFEPNPKMVDRMHRSVVANGFDKIVEIHEQALGSNDAGRQLIIPDGHPGGGFVASVDALVPDGTPLVTSCRMDSYRSILDADLIKIDAEAAEEDIWHGMTGVLAKGRPLTILIEFVACRYGEPDRFLDSIIAEGFSLHYISHTEGICDTTKAEILGLPDTNELMLLLRR